MTASDAGQPISEREEEPFNHDPLIALGVLVVAAVYGAVAYLRDRPRATAIRRH
jgi:hypothetical protein